MEMQKSNHERASIGLRQSSDDFQERTKKLKVAEQEIEKERIQTNIDYKFEERKVKEDLISMSRDKKRFAREAKNRGPELPSLNREKTFQGWTTSEKQRLLRSFSTERSHESFPSITCTVANVPQIMKRSISKESQFHNWLVGFQGSKIHLQAHVSKRTINESVLEAAELIDMPLSFANRGSISSITSDGEFDLMDQAFKVESTPLRIDLSGISHNMIDKERSIELPSARISSCSSSRSTEFQTVMDAFSTLKLNEAKTQENETTKCLDENGDTGRSLTRPRRNSAELTPGTW
ncbi:hypothetical protein OS493_032873 [Desmophyllum pertusum]|uniref:Uncharacterized protein n=1 Tax=Desmophyllum pertusum TaxID=174260 RepID=A0A9W9YMF0_9CNID|nr:hypothetical protein OS493_032873 [Desmophyllum pertusum]